MWLHVCVGETGLALFWSWHEAPVPRVEGGSARWVPDLAAQWSPRDPREHRVLCGPSAVVRVRHQLSPDIQDVLIKTNEVFYPRSSCDNSISCLLTWTFSRQIWPILLATSACSNRLELGHLNFWAPAPLAASLCWMSWMKCTALDLGFLSCNPVATLVLMLSQDWLLLRFFGCFGIIQWFVMTYL